MLSSMAKEFLIKGSSLRTKLDFVAARFDADAVESLRLFLARELGNRPILDADWYPFELYDRLLNHLAQRQFGGDLARLREVGQFSAEKALESTYQTYARGRSFEDFLQRLPLFHQRLYTASRLEVSTLEAKGCTIDVVEMPIVSMPDVHVSCGFFVGAARLLGHESAEGAASPKLHRVRYAIRWI